jgi:hypothetical protein
MQVKYSTYMKMLDLNSAPRTQYLHFCALLSEPPTYLLLRILFIFWAFWCIGATPQRTFNIFSEELTVIRIALVLQGVVPDQQAKELNSNLKAGRQANNLAMPHSTKLLHTPFPIYDALHP